MDQEGQAQRRDGTRVLAWKAKTYLHFIKPKARRMPGNSSGIPEELQRTGTDGRGMCYSVAFFSKVIVWALLN